MCGEINRMTDEKQPDHEPYLTAEQAAEYLGLAVGTIYNRVHKGTIPHYKRERTLRFRRSELDQWIRGEWPDLTAA